MRPFLPATASLRGIRAKGELTRLWSLRCLPPRFSEAFDAYQHPIYRRVLYSPQVFAFLQTTEAFWLLDSIAEWIGTLSFQREVVQDPRVATIHFSTETFAHDSRTALFADCPGVVRAGLVAQHAPFIEFLGDEVELVATCRGALWMLRLPAEL